MGLLPLPFYPVDLFAALLYNIYMTEQESQDKVARVLRNGYCTGRHCKGKGIADDDHTCPFNDEIHPEVIDLCNCCEVCARGCARDI